MKKIIFAATFIVAFSVNVHAQVPSKEEMMKAWQVYMTPGDVHKMLSKWDGIWSEDITMWMDPSAAPTKSKAIVTNNMILGGRYQKSKHEGTMDGQPFEGISTLGYDNTKKMFQSTWIDNMGTGIMFMEGTWDEITKTMHFKGKSTDPVSGKEMEVREEYMIIDNNNHKLEMYMTMPGQPEMKSMVIVLKRTGNMSLKK